VTKVNPKVKEIFELAHSAILIFDSFKNYQQFEQKIQLAYNGPKEINFLIYCHNLTTKVIENNLPQDYFQIRSFLLVENDEIVFKALTLFTPKKCRRQQLIQVNRFSNKTLKWKDQTFFTSIIRDFHGCHLVIHALNDFPDLSKDLNFRYVEHHDYPSLPIDLKLEIWPIDGELFYLREISEPLLTVSLVIVVPPGKAFTSFEKLLLPYDLDVWKLFALTFVIAFGVIFVLNGFRNFSVANFIFGDRATTPALNVFAIFMGITLTAIPKRSISRFLLMIFILFSLIMR
jgi:hypothetical protein